MHEFADVMILANGITADSLAALPSAKTENTDALSAAKSALLKQGSVAGRIFKGRGESVDTVGSERASAEKTGRAALSTSQANKLKKEIVGFMPPRREIGK